MKGLLLKKSQFMDVNCLKLIQTCKHEFDNTIDSENVSN